MSGAASWTSNYWTHHRNSLLLSSALLVLSLPHATVSPGDVLGLKLGLDGSVVLLALFVGATYTIINFAMEWGEEALPTFRTRTDQLVEFSKQVDAAIRDERHLIDQMLSEMRSMDSYTHLARYTSSWREFIGSDTSDPEKIPFNLSTDILFGEVLTKGAETIPVLNEITQRTNIAFEKASADHDRLSEKQQAINKLIENEGKAWTARAFKIFAQNYIEPLEILAREAAEKEPIISAKASELELAFKNASKRRGRASSTWFQRAFEWSRSIWFGIGVPFVLYAIAVAHFFGRIGYVWSGSWIETLIDRIEVTP